MSQNLDFKTTRVEKNGLKLKRTKQQQIKMELPKKAVFDVFVRVYMSLF